MGLRLTVVDLLEGSTEATPQPPRGRRRRPARRRPARRPIQLARVDGLDGLRVLGALGVVVYHVMGSILGPNPAAGVIIPPAAFTFFVISGFVIYRPYAAAHLGRQPMPRLGRYLGSRLIRVLPLWWLALAVYLAIDGTEQLRTPTHWIATVTLFQFVVPEVRFAVIGPAWALSVEWIFYLTAPFLAVGIRELHRRLAPRAPAASVQVAILVPMLAVAGVVPPLRPFLAILIGMLLAVADVERHRARRTPTWLKALRSPGTALAVTAVAWILLLDYPYKDGLSVQWVEQDPAVVAIWITVATAWFAAVAFRPATGLITRRLASPVAVRLGLLTFGLYLWHDLVLQQTLDRLGTDAHLGAVMYLTLLGALVAATATFVTVERPLMALRSRLAGGGPLQVPSPDAPPAPASARPPAARRPTTTPSTTPRSTTGPSVPKTPTPGRGWITSIDGLRVIAAFCVVTFHVGAEKNIPAAWSQGIAALFIPVFSTFFVISGYVLYRPWAMAQARMALGDGRPPKRPPDGGVGSFWLRRVLRVYPVYWVVQGTALAISGTGDLSGPTDWLQVITLFPLPNFDVIINHGLGVIVWTMVVELTFYAVLPFHARLVTSQVRSGASFVTANAVPLALLFVVFAYLGSTSARVLAVACCIVVGMAIAAIDAWQRTQRRWAPGIRRLSRQPTIAVPIVGACWAIGTLVARDDDPDLLFRTHLALHLAAMVIVSFVLFLPAVFGSARSPYRRFLSSAPMRILGPLTFGIYLWHYPLIRETGNRIDLPLPGLLAWVLVATPALALVTYRAIEQPTERLRHQRLGRTASPPPDPVPERSTTR